MLWPAALTLAIFLAGTFIAALVTGVAGFAFALIALAVWLYVLTPVEATPLVALYALLVQGYAVWKLRHRLDARRLAPLVIGSALGVPIGVALLAWVPPAHLRTTVGVLLILFSGYSLARPRLPQIGSSGRVADAGIGLVNGLLGGSTGLAGIAVVIWSGLRGWPRDEQRAVFQPTGVATFLVAILAMGGAGMVTSETGKLFLIGLPALAAGTWAGWRLYGRLDEAAFRRVVLVLLLVSGLALVVAGG
jgi:uncharacterized membrane protein YfcA